jgi:predicted kinase
VLAERFDAGYVRDCHGDLHLGNLVRLDSGITTFDCIEFNEDLRQIDTMCDLGFLVMDLVARGRENLACQCLDRYLEVTGDYGGLAVLRLFVVYRCLVRAKVEVIRSKERKDQDAATNDLSQAAAHCELATRIADPEQPVLVLMHGLSGSGKTWVSSRLLSALPAVRVRSDIERKRLFGISETATSHSAPGEGLYDERSNRRVYDHLADVARTIMDGGYHAIVDAAFLREGERRRFIELGHDAGVATVIVDVTADRETMQDRLRRRQAARRDASEAGGDVLAFQARVHEALTPDERAISVSCDNSGSIDAEAIASSILATASDGD